LLAGQTPQSVAIYYGALACGAVIVPLDPDATHHELEARIRHSQARLVVSGGRETSPGVVSTLASCGVVLSADELLAPLRSRHATWPVANPGLDDLAAILYTSGTTADPKGVMLTHGNFVSNTLGVAAELMLRPDDRVLSPLPLFYAYGSSVLHTHLAVGATIVMTDLLYAQRTVERMVEERVTGFSGVPWMFGILMDRTTLPMDGPRLSHLRYLTQAGARMPAAEIARVRAACPQAGLFVMYGQTEATARLTMLSPAELASHAGSVGRAIAGVRLGIRRADGSQASAGEVGEVVAGGPSIMRGYWRSPQATRAAIETCATGRRLRTGDLGSMDRNGYLYLEGRRSDMIKVGGHRVNPAEVEEAALLLPGVAQAAATGMDDAVLGHVVMLVVVRKDGAGITSADVLAHCRVHLSAQKWPRHVGFADALPYTASGKLQRGRLADLVGVTR
jgi:long-chain acyl-CoA synthetase